MKDVCRYTCAPWRRPAARSTEFTKQYVFACGASTRAGCGASTRAGRGASTRAGRGASSQLTEFTKQYVFHLFVCLFDFFVSFVCLLNWFVDYDGLPATICPFGMGWFSLIV